MLAWTEKAMRIYMAKVVPEGYKLSGHRGKYTVRDDYRPGMSWEGRTPADAMRKAGVWVPRTAAHYTK